MLVSEKGAQEMKNVLAVSFAEDSKAYEALSSLKELDGQGQLDLTAAAVVARSEDGHIEAKDQTGDDEMTGTATGGVIGLVIGILGGPFGILLGGVTGLLIGSLYDLDESDATESALGDISRTVRPGKTALLAEADEQSPDVVDNAMTSLGGSVLRRSLDDVQAEVAAAEEAQRAAAQEARKRLREQRQAKTKEEIRAKIDELKAKLKGLRVGAGGGEES
ncbi:MAG TPA: DUF1269 domain-containing protein [Solirubrobacteraceae bacterium]|nr:DUF1269 domain-containing protein [Solirubrobacteraceae bacterium]